MSDTVQKALALWGMESASYQLIAARENQVYRIDHNDESFALRLHRRDYRNNAELRSELQWIAAIAKSGLRVPTPIKSVSGKYLIVVDGIQIDVLTWLSGKPIGQTGEPLDALDRSGLFFRIGREMARLHTVSDAWIPPEGFTRCAWDVDGLLGEAPVWGRFWDNPTLSKEDCALFSNAKEHALKHLQAISGTLDYGLIHADLVRENVMTDGETLQFIDFDDSGYGFRIFDVATALFKNMGEPDYNELRAAMIDGYKSTRKIDTNALELFMLIRALSYVSWIITRLNEDGSEVRNRRFVTTARRLAIEFLNS